MKTKQIIAGHCNLEGRTEEELIDKQFCEHPCPIKDEYCTKEYQKNCIPARYYDKLGAKK